MLPDTSSMTISRMGWGVLSNCVIGCGLPSSRTSKSVPRQRRDEPAVSIRHGGEDTDGVAPAAKDRLLPPGRTEHAKDTRDQRPAREEPCHAHHSYIRRPGIDLQSYHEWGARGPTAWSWKLEAAGLGWIQQL